MSSLSGSAPPRNSMIELVTIFTGMSRETAGIYLLERLLDGWLDHEARRSLGARAHVGARGVGWCVVAGIQGAQGRRLILSAEAGRIGRVRRTLARAVS